MLHTWLTHGLCYSYHVSMCAVPGFSEARPILEKGA